MAVGYMRATAIPQMFKSALIAWWDDDALRLGASLAYYTLFAIAPILLVATAIAGLAFGAEAVRGEVVGQLDHLIGREGARAVQSLLEGASQRRSGILATVVGSITFVVAERRIGQNDQFHVARQEVRQALLDLIATVPPEAVLVVEGAERRRHRYVDPEAVVEHGLRRGDAHDGALATKRPHDLEHVVR